jgi:hypothetical protein
VPVAGQAVATCVVRCEQTAAVQLGEPIAQNARGHPLAALLQRAKAQVLLAQLPQYPQRPSATQQVERDEQRPTGSGATGRPTWPEPLCFDFRSATVVLRHSKQHIGRRNPCPAALAA